MREPPQHGARHNRHLETPTLWRRARAPHSAPLVILIHGRAQPADAMLRFAECLDLPDLNYAAVGAADGSWYPGRFMDPIEHNQPDLDHSVARVDLLVQEARQHGVGPDRIVVIGYSQGACIASEYVLRRAGRWGGLIVLTGSLLGPTGARVTVASNALDGTPVLVTNGDRDPWIPTQRTRDTAADFRRMGAHVTERIFFGRAHSICPEEIAEVRATLIRFSNECPQGRDFKARQA